MIYLKKMMIVVCAALLGIGAMVGYNDISNEKKSWFFDRRGEGEPPGWCGSFNLEDYNAFYLGDIDKKEIYLTFDEGYEKGYTDDILDVLKEKGVTAAFFVTKPYIKDEPELIQRMVDEGHIVANHTVRHKSSPTLTPDEMKAELEGCAAYFQEITGVEMPKFFRPPMGEYSERTLKATADAGYATIFWSFAYQDWLVNNQPSVEYAHKKVTSGLHNGAILLLHAVSSTNAKALGGIIDAAHEMGYTFKSLDDLGKPSSDWPDMKW